MSNEELESQLSAMFDGELPVPECELLARRLARDEGLKARWGRYAVIGAAMRMEPCACVAGSLARRVSEVVGDEPSLLVGAASREGKGLGAPLRKWWQPAAGVAGVAVAAGMATVAVFLLRIGGSSTRLAARSTEVPSLAAMSKGRPAGLAEATEASLPVNYAVSTPIVESATFAPPVELADFVVAHSEFSMPFLRRSALSALVATESLDASPAAPREASNDAVSDAGADFGTRHAAEAR
jgi:sigma-E factor negative regulatory protein RseA